MLWSCLAASPVKIALHVYLVKILMFLLVGNASNAIRKIINAIFVILTFLVLFNVLNVRKVITL